MWNCLLNITVLRLVLDLHSEPGNEVRQHVFPYLAIELFAISLWDALTCT